MGHPIPYESTVYHLITDYDTKSKQMLMNPQLTIAVDSDKGYSFAVPLFRDKFEKDLQKQKDELKLKAIQERLKKVEQKIDESFKQEEQDRKRII